MNIIELIADALQTPEGAYDRMLEMGVQQQVIDHVLALNRDKSVTITDDFPDDGRGRCITFLVREQ
jgi:hypothetical protein